MAPVGNPGGERGRGGRVRNWAIARVRSVWRGLMRIDRGCQRLWYLSAFAVFLLVASWLYLASSLRIPNMFSLLASGPPDWLDAPMTWPAREFHAVLAAALAAACIAGSA